MLETIGFDIRTSTVSFELNIKERKRGKTRMKEYLTMSAFDQRNEDRHTTTSIKQEKKTENKTPFS